MKTWSCKIGEVGESALPEEVVRDGRGWSADQVMRRAVEAAYRDLTGRPCDFTFSGWGAQLDERERATVEDREPDAFLTRYAEEKLHEIRAYMRDGEDAPARAWSYHEWISVMTLKLGDAARAMIAGQPPGLPDRGLMRGQARHAAGCLMAVAAAALDCIEALDVPLDELP